MDPIQIEAQLRTTFLTLLGGDMTLYEGTKQQYIMRFNNESRNIATGMIAQAQQRNSPINAQDYQAVALDLLNRYKASMPQQQTYAMPVQQPMYQQQYAPMPMQQPIMAQQYAPMPMQQQYRPIMPYNNMRYTQPQQYAVPMQQPMYQPMQPTMAQPIAAQGKSLYDRALPANTQTTQPMAAPAIQAPPMTAVPKVEAPVMSVPQEAPLVQPTYATYAIPQVTGRHAFSEKTPQPIMGEVITYQKENGELINTVVAKTTAVLSDVDSTVRALAKKKNAVDVTLKYTPYKLIAGNLADMQQSFIDVKKIISDGRKAQKNPCDIVAQIIEYCDTKTKGVAKHIEGIILDIYNSYAHVANSSPEATTIIPDTDELECLQVPGTASSEKYISMALSEFEQYSIYDPASIQMSGWLKDVDIMSDIPYAELKKNKSEFSKWAKSHCIIKKPIELYRYSTVDHETTDVSQNFGYTNSTPPDDALEFFTVEAISKEPVRVITMVVQDGKSFITSTGTLDRTNGQLHVEFE